MHPIGTSETSMLNRVPVVSRVRDGHDRTRWARSLPRRAPDTRGLRMEDEWHRREKDEGQSWHSHA